MTKAILTGRPQNSQDFGPPPPLFAFHTTTQPIGTVHPQNCPILQPPLCGRPLDIAPKLVVYSRNYSSCDYKFCNIVAPQLERSPDYQYTQGRSDTFETRFPFRPITNYFRSRRLSLTVRVCSSVASPLAVCFQPHNSHNRRIAAHTHAVYHVDWPPMISPQHPLSGVHGTQRTARRGWNKSLLFLLKWIDTDLHLRDKKASYYLRPQLTCHWSIWPTSRVTQRSKL